MSETEPTSSNLLVEPGREKEFLHLLLEHLPVSVSILDSDLRYRMMSNASFDKLKIKPGELQLGDTLAKCHTLMKANGLLSDNVVEENKLSDSELARQQSRQNNNEAHLIRLGDGSTHRLLRKPLNDGHVMSIATDVTELIEKDSILEEALNLGMSGYWIYDFETKRYTLSNSLKRYFPDAALERIEKNGFLSIVHKDDRANMKEQLANMVENGDRFEYDIRSVSRAGDERWSRTNGELIRDANGRPLKIRAFVHDITRERNHAEELSQMKDEAIAASKAKSEFLANMSHEIRTPMNGVLGMAELLAGSDITERQREYVNVINSSATALLNIINDILDFSKIEAGALEIDPTPFDLKSSITDVTALLIASAQEKGLELIINYDSTLPRHFIGDAGRIRQVVTNLVSNAIKFTHEGHVAINVTMENPETDPVVRIAVTDTGIGIEKEKLKRVFEKFTQADNSTTRLYGGTGLGLTISKRISEMMGGSLDVASTVGEGSTFAMTVPLPRDVNAVEDQFDTDRIRDRRVLIIDDISVNCSVLCSQTRNWAMQPVCADDAMEGLAKLKAAQDRDEPFDLILLDYLMPGLNGRELATLLQDRTDLNVPPIIMLSSCDQSVSSADLSRIGIDSYLVKPVRERRLHETIVRTLSKRPQTKPSPSTAEGGSVPAQTDKALTSAETPPASVPVSTPFPIPTPTPTAMTDVTVDATEAFHQTPASAPVSLPEPSQTAPEPFDPVPIEPAPTAPEQSAAPSPEVEIEEPKEQTAMVSGSGPKQDILVAEDFPLNQDVVRLMLSETQFEPVFAENGQIAVDMYTSDPDRFPAIVMDISMPVMDGYEATRRIRTWEKERGVIARVPIIALTGHALKNDRSVCIEAGMDDYLTKPVKQAALLERLETYSGRVVQQMRIAS